MQKLAILGPLLSGDETILRRHKMPERTLIWERTLPGDVQENVDRLAGDARHRRFMASLHGVWLKAELKGGELLLRKDSWHAPSTGWWQKTVTLPRLFSHQNALPLAQDIETRLRHAFDYFSTARLDVRFFTRLAKYRIVSPHKFHTDTIYVMVLNYGWPCTEFTCSHSLAPVESHPQGSVCIMPPGQIHRSPSYREGVTPFFMAIF